MDFYKLIENKKDELVKNLQGAIKIRSLYEDDDSGYPYGKNVKDCLDYMLKLSESLGFKTYNMDNHLGWCEYGEGEEMVAVLGHLDVVPEGDGWSVPPYEGLVQDGRIYGRGTMDDKGPTMAALYGLLAIKESKLPINKRIRLIFGCNEETGSLDMKYYAQKGGEMPVMGFTPDDEYPVINGEKGLINEQYTLNYKSEGALTIKEIKGGTAHNIVPGFAYAELLCACEKCAEKILALKEENITATKTADGVKVEATGISAHGGTPNEGLNAIGILVKFLNKLPFEGKVKDAIALLAEKIGTEYDGRSLGIYMEDEVSGYLTMNLGVLEGDSKTLSVKLNYRYPVTKNFDMCGPLVKKAFEDTGFNLTVSTHKEKIYMEPESELVKKLISVYTDYTGEKAVPKSIGGGTYAKMMKNVLAFGPIFPGDEVREHKPDEFMEISRLLDNTAIFANAMYELAKN